MKILVQIDKDEDRTYFSYSEDVKGVYGQGNTNSTALADFLCGLIALLEYRYGI